MKTGVLTTGDAPTAAICDPLARVQTGGFGDPNGVPGKADPNKKPASLFSSMDETAPRPAPKPAK